MELEDRPELGAVRIANEVVAVVAGLAATEVEGVAGMAGGFTDGITELWGKKNLARGVKVEVGQREAAVDLYVIIKYGAVIPEVSAAVQRNVKQAIEVMTGLEVVEVNVHVVSVEFADDKESVTEVRVR